MTRLDDVRQALDDARAERAARAATTMPSLFDAVIEPGPVDAAIASVERNASDLWLAHALDAVRHAAVDHAELTTETVWEYVTEQVHDHRAMGAVMRSAAQRGWIRRTDRFLTASRPDWHQRPCRIWESQILDARRAS